MTEVHPPAGAHPVAPDAPFYTIGQVADVLGLQPAALRRLDEERIVSPTRSQGGQRRYSPRELDLLREVTSLTDEGVTLAGVRHVLALRRRVEDLERELAARSAAPRGVAASSVEQAADVGGGDGARGERA